MYAPLEAQAVVELKGFIREPPDSAFSQGVWPTRGAWASFAEPVDSSRVVGNQRLVCATLQNTRHTGAAEGYFVVYFSY
jgi:hypothetical protein